MEKIEMCGHVAGVWKGRGGKIVLVGKSEGKELLGRRRRR
jgi:hypothetical protein